jgi:peptidoglycan/xylan/chitin deacetylase (PgdA/CDA1 family)
MGGKMGNMKSVPRKIKVLMYHRIVDDEHLSREYPLTCIYAEEFRRQLKLLDRSGFTTVNFQDYKLSLEEELGFPKKPVIITFDDGYLDTYEVAFPLLQDFGMKAVIFVLGDRRVKSSIWNQEYGLPVAPLMEDQHIVEMHIAGFEIGSHSMSHADLVSLPEETAWEEISRSRVLLEILLNTPVLTFAYPYGSLDATTKKLVADAGYAFGCSTYTGPATFGLEKYEIRRILVPHSPTPLGFATRLLTPFERYQWIRTKTVQRVFGSRLKYVNDWH